MYMDALTARIRAILHRRDAGTAIEFAVLLAILAFAYWALTTLMER